MLLQVSQFSPFALLLLLPLPSSIPPLVSCPWVMHGFLGFSISYTILNLPLSIFCLPFMLPILCTFSPSLPIPADNPPCDLHFCDSSVPVLVFCLVRFCFFKVWLLIAVSLLAFYCSYFLSSFSSFFLLFL